MSITIKQDGENEWLVKITDVIISYPHLFEPYRPKTPLVDANGKVKPGKYGAKFLIDRRDPLKLADAKVLHAKIVEMQKVVFKSTIAADRLCLRDGRQLTEDMHNFFVVSASEDIKPTVVDRRRNPVSDEDDLFYAGARVNATIRLWAQNSAEWGKRINANLIGVQFFAHGDRLGGRAKPKVDELFDDVSDQFDDDEYEGGPTGDATSSASGDDGFGDDGDGL